MHARASLVLNLPWLSTIFLDLGFGSSANKGTNMTDYKPQPIDTSDVVLDGELDELTEKLAENAHENWALMRFADQWQYGPSRDDKKKEHPNLVPYSALTETDKDLDRRTAMETIKAIVALGYSITKN